MKKNLWGMAAGVLGLAFTATIAANTVITVKMYKELAKLSEEKVQEEATKENDVIISNDYLVLDTSKISKAYLSGNTDDLNEQELETLAMAEEVIREVITDQMSDYEKELAIYDWMVDHIAHDSSSVVAIPTLVNAPDKPYGVLKNRKAVCVGYATTFRMFMQMLDIESMVVHDTDYIHTWNMVKLDGEWYIIDIYNDVDGARYYNFNLSEQEFLTRQEWDTDFFPEANGVKYSYANRNSEELEDIYRLPQLAKDLLETGTSGTRFYRVKGGLNSDIVKQGEYMLERISDYAYSLYDTNENIYLFYSSIPIDEDQTILAIYLTFDRYNAGSKLDEETLMNIEMKLEEVFGSWSDYEYDYES